MVDQHQLGDALSSALSNLRVVLIDSPAWRDELLAAIHADDAKALVALLERPDATLLSDAKFDLSALGRQGETENFLAYCCYARAFETARLLAYACSRLENGPSWVSAAAEELAAQAAAANVEDADLIARSIAELSVGQAMSETREGSKHLYPSPMLPRGAPSIARAVLASFAARKFCSLGGRRSVLRAAMASIAEGDERSLASALSSIQVLKQAYQGDASRLFLMLDEETRFFVGACVNCDRAGCLFALLDWAFKQFDAAAGAEKAANAIMDVLNSELAYASLPRSSLVMDAITRSVSEFCDRRGERGVGAVRAVCGELAPALREAATTATLISLSRREKAEFCGLLPTASPVRSAARL